MADLKREYVIPLRRKTRTAPKWRRSKKAVSVLKEFVSKHMKSDEVVILSELNEFIWARGAKNPPGKVSVITLKREVNGKDRAFVNLLDAGLEHHMKKYEMPEAPKVEETTQAKEEVKDAEVKEVSEEPKKEATEKKAETKEDKK